MTEEETMKIIKINFKKIEKKRVNLIIDYFKKGKVVVYPTDTIYGLGCIADNKKAIDKIYKIKKREKKKPLLILVNSLAMAKKYCYVSEGQKKFLRRIWGVNIDEKKIFTSPNPLLLKEGELRNRPVTVILKSRGVLPKELAGEKETLAVRLPKNDFLIKIIKGVGQPIVSTSVNISGEKPLQDVGSIKTHFKSPYTPFVKGGNSELPDLVVDAGRLQNKPSRIIDVIDIKNIKVLRK